MCVCVCVELTAPSSLADDMMVGAGGVDGVLL